MVDYAKKQQDLQFGVDLIVWTVSVQNYYWLLECAWSDVGALELILLDIVNFCPDLPVSFPSNFIVMIWILICLMRSQLFEWCSFQEFIAFLRLNLLLCLFSCFTLILVECASVNCPWNAMLSFNIAIVKSYCSMIVRVLSVSSSAVFLGSRAFLCVYWFGHVVHWQTQTSMIRYSRGAYILTARWDSYLSMLLGEYTRLIVELLIWLWA